MTNDLTQRVAEAFARCLLEDIGADNLRIVIARNAKLAPCASHDFCDANMTMARAMAQVLGREGWLGSDVEEGDCTQEEADADNDLWNAAWDLAVKESFAAVLPLQQLEANDHGTFDFMHGGVSIADPRRSECGRFVYNPEQPEGFTPAEYGFKITGTGGNCTAWRRDFLIGTEKVYMLLTAPDEASHEISPTEGVGIGVYTDDEGMTVVSWTQVEDEEFGHPEDLYVEDQALYQRLLAAA